METMRHNAEIQDQFTKQADTFLARHGNSKDGLLELMAEAAQLRARDNLLDIACGPGIVSCFFARQVKHVTGLDAVPAMLERAARLQAQYQLSNIEWILGDAAELPFASGSFDRVVTRFSFHHFADPLAVLMEMKRVAKEDGIVVVADVAPREDAQDTFNCWEVLRDPSHTRALTCAEIKSMGDEAGLEQCCERSFDLEMDLEDLLRGSFPKPGDMDRIRILFENDLKSHQDSLGVTARRVDGAIRITYPVAILSWCKSSTD